MGTVRVAGETKVRDQKLDEYRSCVIQIGITVKFGLHHHVKGDGAQPTEQCAPGKERKDCENCAV
jgi:hypothetical protein